MLDGKVTYEAVAEAHGLAYTPLDDALHRGALGRGSRLSLLLRGSGLYRTTSQVTPAASETTQTMKKTNADQAET